MWKVVLAWKLAFAQAYFLIPNGSEDFLFTRYGETLLHFSLATPIIHPIPNFQGIRTHALSNSLTHTNMHSLSRSQTHTHTSSEFFLFLRLNFRKHLFHTFNDKRYSTRNRVPKYTAV